MGRITYETHFKSKRADGRHTTSYAAYLERMRNTPQSLKLPEKVTYDEFVAWRETVIKK